MKHFVLLSCVMLTLYGENAAYAALAVSNADFVEIDWWSGIGKTQVDAMRHETVTNPSHSLGENWQINLTNEKKDVPITLLGSRFSPEKGRDQFASIQLSGGAQFVRYLGVAERTGPITVSWRTALRADQEIPQDDLRCVLMTSNDASIATSASARMVKELDYAMAGVQRARVIGRRWN